MNYEISYLVNLFEYPIPSQVIIALSPIFPSISKSTPKNFSVISIQVFVCNVNSEIFIFDLPFANAMYKII